MHLPSELASSAICGTMDTLTSLQDTVKLAFVLVRKSPLGAYPDHGGIG